ncbi:methylmalonyl-CoA mutase family protein [Neobacillus citreus]|uniref:Methylmalonyl-CoA mutase small subunit n=1 Tax=Neobacillus citreus TaxID=2833578 RepID=A0A942T4G1_9BACI|nr:methylmalonyl-CoA mutase family protein [Neobacillus citreus]MCH6267986.1 methylmalonyl-CoA mutase subunit beta [Neobacillus citreus]
MRSLENIRNQSFPVKTIDDWKEQAEKSLKGKKIELLQSTTYENIVLKPLYTEQDEQQVPDYPGGSDFRRGIAPLGYVTDEWKVAQKISYRTPEELKQKLQEALEKGQTAISFEVSKTNSFPDLLAGLEKKYPFAINARWELNDMLKNLAGQYSDGTILTGYIGNDPVSLFAEVGAIQEELLKERTSQILQADGKFPDLRTVLVDTTPYHNGGANAVQELGIAAATGVYYLQELLDNGMNIEKALSKMIFQFSIGSNFFMELSKLRAARVLWKRIAELYGAEAEARGMQIAATTSSFTKTNFDSHVNILRSANEAFAAVLGGAQYLHVEPFNELTGPTSFSERIARNIQLILKEEAHLQKVVDPAGGSWYVETLTNQLAENAWGFFKEIEAAGGILEALKSNWLQQQIAAVYEKKNLDIQIRKQSIVGTNVYAKLDEAVPSQKQLMKIAAATKDFEAIPQHRLAEPYEELRFKANQLQETTGAAPSVGMLCLGELKQHKPRLDFMKGFLAAGGIHPAESKPVHTIEDARQFIIDLKTNFVCICGTNEQYEQIGHEMLTALKSEFPNLIFLLAGLPEKELQAQWYEEGLKRFIHVKSNCCETIDEILSDMEVNSLEQTKA